MTEVCAGPDLVLSSPLTEADIKPFFNEERLMYGPVADEQQAAYLERYARARNIVSHLNILNSVENDLKGRAILFELNRMKLKPLHNFLLDELSSTGHPLLLDVCPKPGEHNIPGTKRTL